MARAKQPPPALDRSAALLAAIHADPDDIEARLVYADALSETGDPRGEFIALQCRGTPDGERERALVAEHGARWLGRLAGVVDVGRTRFERGFATSVFVPKGPRPKLLATVGDPVWSTVRDLELHRDIGGVAVKNGTVVRGVRVPAAALVLHPVMRALRSVRGIDGDVLLTLCGEGEALPIEEIHASTYPLLERDGDNPAVDTYRVAPAEQAILEAGRGLPNLRRLTLHGYPCNTPDLTWLLRSPLAGRLASLHLENFGGVAAQWKAMALAAHRDLGELVVEYRGAVFTFRRGADGTLGYVRS